MTASRNVAGADRVDNDRVTSLMSHLRIIIGNDLVKIDHSPAASASDDGRFFDRS
jgi:hypothetical protein